MKRQHIALAAAFATLLVGSPVAAWDSAKFKWLTPIVHPTHSYLTEYAIDQLADKFVKVFPHEYKRVLGVERQKAAAHG